MTWRTCPSHSVHPESLRYDPGGPVGSSPACCSEIGHHWPRHFHHPIGEQEIDLVSLFEWICEVFDLESTACGCNSGLHCDEVNFRVKLWVAGEMEASVFD